MQNKTLIIMAYLENIAIVIAICFLSWYFKNLWPMLLVFAMNSFKSKSREIEEGE